MLKCQLGYLQQGAPFLYGISNEDPTTPFLLPKKYFFIWDGLTPCCSSIICLICNSPTTFIEKYARTMGQLWVLGGKLQNLLNRNAECTYFAFIFLEEVQVWSIQYIQHRKIAYRNLFFEVLLSLRFYFCRKSWSKHKCLHIGTWAQLSSLHKLWVNGRNT